MKKENTYIKDLVDVSQAIGESLCGRRSSALLSKNTKQEDNSEIIKAIKQHIPLVIYNLSNRDVLSTNCIQLFAANSNEFKDFKLIARRISELALTPVILNYDNVSNTVLQDAIDNQDFVVSYLGNADDVIDSPSPSQEIVFGNKRRRLPIWFDLNQPLAIGISKDKISSKLEFASNREFFTKHIYKLTQQAFNEFNKLSKKKYSFLNSYNIQNAKHIIISQGASYNDICEYINTNSISDIACLNLSVFNPFPEKEILNILKDKISLTVLENNSSSLYKELTSKLYHLGLFMELISGVFCDKIYDNDIKAVIENIKDNNSKKYFYLGLDFINNENKFPKHEILIGNIKRHYPNIQDLSLTSSNSNTENQIKISSNVPFAIRQYMDAGPAYSKLSRFYNDISLFYKIGAENKILADPFQALPLVPASTASFSDFTSKRNIIPKFDSIACTACGDCYTVCPHSALPPLAIGVKDMISGVLDNLNKKGATLSKLKPILTNYSKITSSVIENNRDKFNNVKQFLEEGFKEYIIKAKLEGNKLEEIESEFNLVLQELNMFDVAVTDVFFNQKEDIEKGTGEFFSLNVDVNSCTGCGICIESCDENALISSQQDEVLLENYNKKFSLWESLPDTSSDTIKRLYKSEDFNSFSAILLSRNYYMSLNGGTEDYLSAPSKQLLHLTTALLESIAQAKVISLLKNIDTYISKLDELVKKELISGLPSDDFTSLQKTLNKHKKSRLRFDDVINELSDNELVKMLDATSIKNKLELAASLKELKKIYLQGPSGTGKARYSMAISSSGCLTWTQDYPSNVFTAPVLINDKISISTIKGIVEAQIKYLLDNIKLLRRAELESKNKYNKTIHDKEISSLSWNCLTKHEKELLPPIIFVTDINKAIINEVIIALAEDYPIKVILLDEACYNDKEIEQNILRKNSILLSAISTNNAFVYQGNSNNYNKLFSSLQEGMASSKPALFSLYCPNIDKHIDGINTWHKLSALAESSKIVPTIKYKAQSSKLSSISTLLSIQDDSTIINSWKDWALSLKDWQSHFDKYEDETGDVTYKESDRVIEVSEFIDSQWRFWRELSGNLTEFPEKLENKVKQTILSEFEDKMKEEQVSFENKLKQQEAQQTEIARLKLRDKLVALSKQRSR